MVIKDFNERELLSAYRQLGEADREEIVTFCTFKVSKQKQQLNENEMLFMQQYRELTEQNRRLVDRYCMEIGAKQRERNNCIKGRF